MVSTAARTWVLAALRLERLRWRRSSDLRQALAAERVGKRSSLPAKKTAAIIIKRGVLCPDRVFKRKGERWEVTLSTVRGQSVGAVRDPPLQRPLTVSQ